MEIDEQPSKKPEQDPKSEVKAPTSLTLTDKWFLKIDPDTKKFPPLWRATGSTLAPFTTNNEVHSLIDGMAVMTYIADTLQTMISLNSPETPCELWIANWTITKDIRLSGVREGSKTMQTLFLEATHAGVKIYFLGSGHGEQFGPAIGVFKTLPSQEFAKLLSQETNGFGISDDRNLRIGSHHQKFYIIRIGNEWSAIVGSVDLNTNRWDDTDHKLENPLRPHKKPSHELAVLVKGPAVQDIAKTFIERWTDTSNIKYINPNNEKNKSITKTIPVTPSIFGKCAIQVLRTYPINPSFGYSWSGNGEFTIWSSYLNAIDKAKRYIYIEDQFFYDFGFKEGNLVASGSTSLFEKLAVALQRGVYIVVLVPNKTEDAGGGVQIQNRNIVVTYLNKIGEKNLTKANENPFIIRYPTVGDTKTFVHSKLMIIDDEVVLIGSANFCRRSMTHDSELQLAIVDEEKKFPRTLRHELLSEQLNLSIEELETLEFLNDQSVDWIKLFRNNNSGRGRLYDYIDLLGVSSILNFVTAKSTQENIWDPHGGPKLQGEEALRSMVSSDSKEKK